jgi:hypothetical protein
MATPVESAMSAQAAACERRYLLRRLAAGGLAWAGVAAAAPPPAEMARIDRLLTAVAARKDIRMVRNGRDYDTTMACEFLRRKLSTMGGEVRTAEEFIERIAHARRPPVSSIGCACPTAATFQLGTSCASSS